MYLTIAKIPAVVPFLTKFQEENNTTDETTIVDNKDQWTIERMRLDLDGNVSNVENRTVGEKMFLLSFISKNAFVFFHVSSFTWAPL